MKSLLENIESIVKMESELNENQSTPEIPVSNKNETRMRLPNCCSTGYIWNPRWRPLTNLPGSYQLHQHELVFGCSFETWQLHTMVRQSAIGSEPTANMSLQLPVRVIVNVTRMLVSTHCNAAAVERMTPWPSSIQWSPTHLAAWHCTCILQLTLLAAWSAFITMLSTNCLCVLMCR